MKENKIGTIFLISALAIAGIGISYAGFSDNISVYGTVTTGTVELDLEAYSGTDVYKVWGIDISSDDEVRIFRGYDFERPDPNNPAAVRAYFDLPASTNIELVASAWSHDYDGDEDFGMTFDNLFPCIDFTADFIVHYEGSVPAKVNIADWIMYTDWLEELYAAGGVTIVAYRCTVPNPDQPIGPDNHPQETQELVTIGTQLHYCDYVVVKLTLHLPQSNYWQSRTGEFAGKVGVIQWNDMCTDDQPADEDYLTELKLHILNGIADDSFDVYVDGVYVYTYTDNVPANDPELWIMHKIDLTPYAILCGTVTNTVKIDATGTQWGSFNTYGQLAVDEITLSCDNGNTDTVDIGDTTSEAGHNLVDWGPIEPATSGGNYGGIDDCRVTWYNGGLYTYATIDFDL